MEEEWKICPLNEKYECSNLGNIRNAKTKRQLKFWTGGAGYYYTWLGAKKKSSVHKAIALTFLPNENNYPQIDHIDRVKTNNCVSNLRWVTRSSNMFNIERKGFSKKVLENKYIYYEVINTLGPHNYKYERFKTEEEAINRAEEIKSSRILNAF